MSGEHTFIDTNILVYAHDSDAGITHRSAKKRNVELWNAPYSPALSTQVLQELYVILSKRVSPPVTVVK